MTNTDNDDMNVSDIMRSTNDNQAPSTSENDFFKLVSGDENEVESPQKQKEVKFDDVNYNPDEDTDLGLPSSIFADDKEENSPQKQKEVKFDDVNYNPDEDTDLGLPSSIFADDKENSPQKPKVKFGDDNYNADDADIGPSSISSDINDLGANQEQQEWELPPEQENEIDNQNQQQEWELPPEQENEIDNQNQQQEWELPPEQENEIDNQNHQQEWELPPEQENEVQNEKQEWEISPDAEKEAEDNQNQQENPEPQIQPNEEYSPVKTDELQDQNDANSINEDKNAESDNGDEQTSPITTPKKSAKKVESPSDSKEKGPMRYTQSYKEFLARNDHCHQRHLHPETERMSSPSTIKYPKPPELQESGDKKVKMTGNKRLNELFNESIKPGPSNTNYAPKPEENADASKTSPSKKEENDAQQNTKKMSEESEMLANSKFSRMIDLSVGKKARLTRSQMCGVLRKFYIKNEKDRSEIFKLCGDGNSEKEEEEDVEEEEDENKTYSAESLKNLLKKAALNDAGGSPIVRKIRPSVRAAIFDMKQPIVSPMTQKQRVAMFPFFQKSKIKTKDNE